MFSTEAAAFFKTLKLMVVFAPPVCDFKVAPNSTS
jgi:hypothetical protein